MALEQPTTDNGLVGAGSLSSLGSKISFIDLMQSIGLLGVILLPEQGRAALGLFQP